MDRYPELPIEISDEDSEDEPQSDDESESVEESNETNKFTALSDLKWNLKRCLDKIQTSGNVAFSKHHKAFVNPGLMVADNLIPLPLVPRDAETLKSVCREAPFGRGDKTVVDTSVRKTWELDSTQFRFTNPEWRAYVTSLVEDTMRSLAMSSVKAEPYKLLLYEEGSFFKRHKDSEKAPGMIGTLVICLPSKHEGGSVHLSHAGKKYVFNTDKASEFGLTSLSWFSDVTHEIKPLQSGYRLVLTYNIVYTSGVRMSAGLVGEQSNQLSRVLTRWQTKVQFCEKLVYKLAHKYTQSSLSLNNLKGRDRAVCQSLYEVGLDSGFAIFLATMTRTQGDADGGYYDDDIEEGTELTDVKTLDGLTVCKKIDLDEEGQDILGSDHWDRDPDSEEEGEFTGNEGMPTTFRYHDTVVVILPVHKLIEVLPITNPCVVMDIVNRRLNERPNDQILQSAMLELLEKTARMAFPNSAFLSDVITMSIKFQKKTLYREAVYASLRGMHSDAGMPVFVTIIGLVKEAFLKDPHGQFDWDYWLGDVVTAASKKSLRTVEVILSQLDSILQGEDLKDSFRKWRALLPEKLVASKSKLDLGDCDTLIGLLNARFHDSSWIADWLVPLLSGRGSKVLIWGLLRNVYHIHNTKSLPGALDNFRCILEGCTKRLTLQLADFPMPSAMTIARNIQSDEATSLRCVLAVVDRGFELGLTQQTTELLNTSCTNICQFCPEPRSKTLPCPVVIRHFLETLAETLRNRNVPPHESVKNMFVVLLRNIIVFNPPKLPQKPKGWSFKARPCHTPNCLDCKSLNEFLTDSETQTLRWRMAEYRRKHIQWQLPDKFFQCTTDKSSKPYELIITKRGKDGAGQEYLDDMEQWRAEMQKFELQTFKLRNDYVESLLGKDLYEELVMLKGIPSSTVATSIENRKRKAEEDLEGSSASRPKLIE